MERCVASTYLPGICWHSCSLACELVYPVAMPSTAYRWICGKAYVGLGLWCCTCSICSKCRLLLTSGWDVSWSAPLRQNSTDWIWKDHTLNIPSARIGYLSLGYLILLFLTVHRFLTFIIRSASASTAAVALMQRLQMLLTTCSIQVCRHILISKLATYHYYTDANSDVLQALSAYVLRKWARWCDTSLNDDFLAVCSCIPVIFMLPVVATTWNAVSFFVCFCSRILCAGLVSMLCLGSLYLIF